MSTSTIFPGWHWQIDVELLHDTLLLEQVDAWSGEHT
jgi:hypothetical protein